MFIMGSTATRQIVAATPVTLGNDTGIETGSTTQTLAKPVHTNGDIIVAFQIRSFSNAAVPDLMSGWTNITTGTRISSTWENSFRASYKVGDGTTATESFTQSNGVMMVALVNGTTSFTFAQNKGGGNVVESTVTPTSNGGLHLVFYSTNNRGIPSTPTDMTLVRHVSDVQHRIMCWSAAAPSSGTPTGDETLLTSGTTGRDWHTLSLICETA